MLPPLSEVLTASARSASASNCESCQARCSLFLPIEARFRFTGGYDSFYAAFGGWVSRRPVEIKAGLIHTPSSLHLPFNPFAPAFCKGAGAGIHPSSIDIRVSQLGFPFSSLDFGHHPQAPRCSAHTEQWIAKAQRSLQQARVHKAERAAVREMSIGP